MLVTTVTVPVLIGFRSLLSAVRMGTTTVPPMATYAVFPFGEIAMTPV
jgi:hypothetical protein